MEIDFIKWMVGYAKEFDWMEYDKDDIELHTPWRLNGDPFTDFDSEEWKDLYFPLLLQRAIEGVNINSRWLIMQGCNHIDVYDSLDERKEFIIEVPQDVDSIDQAKEQALKYIWEQEKNND